jgi:uncharacterized protein YukJ
LSGYGVLTARVLEVRREDEAETPHLQVRVSDDDGTVYRIAVNVRSQQSPPDLLYVVDDDLHHPVTGQLAPLTAGWHPLAPGPGGPNLDFVRGNLFDPTAMRALPASAAGPDNDLADLLEHNLQRAITDGTARLFAFGQRWGPETDKRDKIFAFEPGNGVHDIHMNQGSSGQFRGDNGVWQDGGLLVHLAAADRWVGIFLAFQSQAWHTDDKTGDAIGDAPPSAQEQTASVRIIGALINPVGPAPEGESVLIVNASPDPVDLGGWRIADKAKHSCSVPRGELAPGTTLTVALTDGVALGNNGGVITLLDSAGLKVSGVAYTDEDARREGWLTTF